MKASLRLLLPSLFFLAVAGHAMAEDAPPVTVKTLTNTDKTVLGQPLVLPRDHPAVVVSTYDIAPGARLPRHKHPFSRFAYVLAGDLTVEFDDGVQHRYHAGDVIVEAVDSWHFGANTGSVPVRLLVIDLVEAGQPNTILAK